jgi:hypothetical protein
MLLAAYACLRQQRHSGDAYLDYSTRNEPPVNNAIQLRMKIQHAMVHSSAGLTMAGLPLTSLVSDW